MKQNLNEIYDAIKPLLQKQVPPFTAIHDSDKGYELSSLKDVFFMGKTRKVYFAAVKKQKSFVGFYLMTIYAQPKLIDTLGPELRKALKGKSCFHITKTDKTILAQMKKALDDGRKYYKAQGWV
jgi:hypothetical protein